MAARGIERLEIRHFAQIAQADVELGDLTVLVGPQATGKSLALQLLKLCLDGPRVRHELADNGFTWSKTDEFIERVFGEGMKARSRSTRVRFRSRTLSISDLAWDEGRSASSDKLFYIPAQRALTIAGGWPDAFRAGPPGTPYVVRRFSEGLADVLRRAGPGARLFPLDSKLKGALRDMINEAFFHDARLELHTIRGQIELRLAIGKDLLPAMAWTAGQREFVPLLVALYALLPGGKKTKEEAVDWIVLEEPEMGLHPKAILAVMLLVLELLARGYKVILSTHHPLVLDVVWGLRRIQEGKKHGQMVRVLEMFGQEEAWRSLHGIAAAAVEKQYRVTHFDFTENGVETTDISELDPGSDDETMGGWGGLSGLSGRIGDVVAEAVSR
jgi:hypothetical protein